MNLQPGQNISITRQSPTSASLELVLSWQPTNTPLEIDTSAFALSAQGKVRGDEDFIFYNQPSLPGGGIQRSADGRQFQIQLQNLPPAIEKIALSVTIHEGRSRGQTFSQLSGLRVDLRDTAQQTPIAAFEMATTAMAETAVIAVEIYKRNNEWKFRAVGQGFVGGLGPLASQYGVDVGEDPDQAPAPPPVAPKPAAPPPATPSPQAAPPSPVRLGKITLDKKGPGISLEKKGQGFGEIVVNLNWEQASPSKGGFLGRLRGSQQTDLDLGCLIQMANGQTGAIQALGNNFGNLHQPPYIQLMGDDRSGQSAAGEFLHINGQYWDQIRRVLVFAFIYEGAANWAAANAVVTIKAPKQPTLEVRLDEHRSDRGMCAIAMLENRAGSLHVSKLVEYFRSHQPMDEAYRFGLRWVAGSKD